MRNIVLGFLSDTFKNISKTKPNISNQKSNIKTAASAGQYARSFYGSAGGYFGGGAKWPFGLSGSGRGIILNHRELRQNARTAYHQTPQARSLIDRYADTVVDIGLMLEPAPKSGLLGITDEQAERWSEKVSESFDSWARSKKQYRTETMTFYQAQRLYEIFQQRDNDIFTRLYYSDNKSLLNPLQFSFIDPDQIRGSGLTTSYSYYNRDDGIIRNSKGVETHYKIWKRNNKENKYDMVTIPRIGSKSKRVFMLHGFNPEYAGQGRGYSRLAHALQEFENITDFTSAQIKKAINQSNITMFVEPSKDRPSSQPFEDLVTNRGAGPISEQYGANPEPAVNAENVTTESTNPVNYCQMPEVTIDTPGSTGVFNLQQGEKLVPFKNSTPAESFDKFVDSFSSHLAASMSMPLEVLLMKFNSNYSASRAALILFWRVAQIWREEMATDFLNPIYEMWLSEEIAAGRISAPGWTDPRIRAAWLNNRWIGAPMPNIDPMKTAKADKEYVTMGAQTLGRVARNLNGSNVKTNMAKLRREFLDLPDNPWAKNGKK